MALEYLGNLEAVPCRLQLGIWRGVWRGVDDLAEALVPFLCALVLIASGAAVLHPFVISGDDLIGDLLSPWTENIANPFSGWT